MSALAPGFNTQRLLRLMREAAARCELDLRGAVVLTEAASGAYMVTPVLAALAGARVLAVTRTTRYGTADEIAAQTQALAVAAAVADRVAVYSARTPGLFAQADIVTNSGHVRPLDAPTIAWMKPTAVIPLMYEAWEYRAADVDLAACRERGIPVAGTNERHPAVDVFSFLGIMAVKLLLDAGIAVYASRVLLVCDNDFGLYIERGLRNAGAEVTTTTAWPTEPKHDLDAILYAVNPARNRPPTATELQRLTANCPGVVMAQYWGDLDRPALAAAGVRCWPESPPALGHMGILPSAVGPEPIVRLQSGGLKVGEILLRARRAGATAAAAVAAAAECGFGQALEEQAV